MNTGAPRVAAPMDRQAHSVERPAPARQATGSRPVKRPAPARQATGSRPVKRPEPARQSTGSRPVKRPSPAHKATGPHPVKRSSPARQATGSRPVERAAHPVSGAHSVGRSAPAHQARGPRPIERPVHLGSEHIVGEYLQEGPIVGGLQDVTSLTGDRLSPISGLPGRDAHIPSGPRSRYVPSYSDSGKFKIDSADTEAL
jgi:hypothetical protein